VKRFNSVRFSGQLAIKVLSDVSLKQPTEELYKIAIEVSRPVDFGHFLERIQASKASFPSAGEDASGAKERTQGQANGLDRVA
jgi:hypothetical protein